MKFQIVSDLHLELCTQYSSFYIPPCAPYLILAGDIGRLNDAPALSSFLATQCAAFKLVIYILGNHEFYGSTRAKGLEAAKILVNDSRMLGKLRVLDRGTVDIDDDENNGENGWARVTILGCTLHSRIRPENESVVAGKVKDFQRIEEWTVERHNGQFERDLGWLKREVAEIRERKEKRRILVVTHHAPIREGGCEPGKEESPWADGFGTDLVTDEIPEGKERWFEGVDCWIFGHTHFTTHFRRAGVRLVSNQRGYVFPGASNGFEDAQNSGKKVENGYETQVLGNRGFRAAYAKILRGFGSKKQQGVTARNGRGEGEKQGPSAFDVRVCIDV